MQEELDREFEIFLEDMKRGEVFCGYFDETDYECDYSHNEIDEWKSKFIDKVREWLHINKPGKYVVTSGWCVFVMTIEEAKKRRVFKYEIHVIE